MTNDAGVPGAPRFDVVLRGYDRRQVDEHVDRLQRVLSRMRADLEVVRSQPMPAVTPAPRPADAPRPRPTPRPRSGPAAPPDTIGNFTDRMESILAEAEAEAVEIRRNAHVAARAETDGVRAQVADLVRQRDAVLGELTRMRAQLEGMLAAPTAQMAAYEPAARPPAGRSESDTTPARSTSPARPPSPDEPATAPSAPSAPSASSSANGTPAVEPAAAPAGPVPSPSEPQVPGTAQPGPSGDEASGGADPVRSGGADPARQAPGTAQPSGPQPPPVRGGPPEPRQAAAQAPTAQAEQVTTAQAVVPPPVREAGKAAHRLPTGAYPAVTTEQTSMRPRTEPEIEPADLFRPRTDGRPLNPPRPAEPRTTAVPQQPAVEKKPASSPDRTSSTGRDQGSTDRPGGAEATTMVGAVRPEDATILAPAPGPTTRPVPQDGQPDNVRRSGSSSRSA